MATTDSATLELADSIPQEKIPAKLRCANCNKLAIDAVKLPCCDQSICLLCSQDLPESCPVCGHSPISADDCKPNKSLRSTIKAFLKTEEKKRSKETEIPVVESVEATTPAVAPSETPALQEQAVEADTSRNLVNGESYVSETPAIERTNSAQGEASVAEPMKEANGDETGHDLNVEPAEAEQEEDDEDEDNIIITTERPDEEVHTQEQAEQSHEAAPEEQQLSAEQQQEQMSGQPGFGGFDQGQGGFGGMNFNNMAAFNPMMGMGMNNFGLGMPNMMGMPGGMNMDPSMMNFGGGFGGMGMGDMGMMGMGMMGGMNGMGGGFGPGGFGAGGMGGPGMGFNGPNGYNNQNFGNNHMMNQNFRNDRGFGRPYGRGGRGFQGRGGYGFDRGRGGYRNQGFNQGPQQQYGQQQYMQQQPDNYSQEVRPQSKAGETGRRASPSYEPMNGAEAEKTSQPPRDLDVAGDKPAGENANEDATNPTDDANAETEMNGEGGAEVSAKTADGTEVTGGGEQTSAQAEPHVNGAAGEQQQIAEDPSVAPNAVNGTTPLHNAPPAPHHDQQYQQGFGYSPRGGAGFRGGRGGFRGGRGGFANYPTEATDLTPAPAPPINAPSGPKAMREGKPNTGWYSRPKPTVVAPAVQPTPQPDERRPRTAERDERGGSRDRSRSPSRHRSRKHRHRSPDDDYESEETYRRRKERKRRERKDRESKYDEDGVEDDRSSRKDRSREESRDDKYRDRDDERRSHRDRSRERRKRRHRSRSPEKEASVNGDAEDRSRRKSKSDRKYDDDYDELDRAKDKDRSRRHSRRDDDYDSKDRSSHRHGRSSRDDGKEREREKAKIEADDDIGFKIKGSKSASINPSGMAPPPRRDRHEHRRTSEANIAPATPTSADPYAAEREKRHAEREQKEKQRRQSTQSGLGKRMTRDDEEEDGGLEAPKGPKGDQARQGGRKGKKRREMSVKYEDEIGDGYAERESRRWR